MADAPNIAIRPCFERDLEQVQLIYAHHVLNGTGTFENDPPPLSEMEARWSYIVDNDWPWLVATPADDITRIAGFAYAGQFRPRAAYARTFEDSVYIAPPFQGRGVGKALLAELIDMLRHAGVRELVAMIGDEQNVASLALHASAGFRRVGLLENVGFKFDRWLHVVAMQKTLAT